MPPTCVYTFYFFWRDFFTFGKSLVFICVRGATFFIWRDFFIWRVFYAGAWVQTLFIPYYSVMNVVSNNPINPCIPLHTLVYLHIPSRKDEVRERIPMPRLTKVSLRYYNWQIRCLCMGRWGGGGGGAGSSRLPHPLHTLDYPCKPLYTLFNTCIPLYTPILPIYPCIPLYTCKNPCILLCTLVYL